jgi:adenosylhomocysteine nucleosidase
MLAYVAALYDEISLVLRRGRFETVVRAPGGVLAFLAPGSGPGRTELVVATGWGAEAAAAGARWVAREMRPSAMVAVGYAGGTQPRLKAGTLAIGERVAELRDALGSHAPADSPELTSDRALLGLAHSSAQAAKIPVAAGLVGSTPDIVASARRKAALGGATGALCIDLETWHLARAATDANIPFLAVRAVVDTVDDDLPGFVERMAPGPRPPAAVPALRYALVRPSSVRGIIRTGIAAGRARRALAEFVSVFSARWSASGFHEPGVPR